MAAFLSGLMPAFLSLFVIHDQLFTTGAQITTCRRGGRDDAGFAHGKGAGFRMRKGNGVRCAWLERELVYSCGAV